MENFEINQQILSTYHMPDTRAAAMKIKVDRSPALKMLLSVGACVYILEVLVSSRLCLTLITAVLKNSVQGNRIITNIYSMPHLYASILFSPFTR